MSASYRVVLDVTVYDFDELRSAAAARAERDGLSPEAWKDLRNSNLSKVSADLHMLLDPGMSPPGVSIENAEVVFEAGEELEEP